MKIVVVRILHLIVGGSSVDGNRWLAIVNNSEVLCVNISIDGCIAACVERYVVGFDGRKYSGAFVGSLETQAVAFYAVKRHCAFAEKS